MALGLTAACALAGAAVLQHDAASGAPAAEGFGAGVRLLGRLLRRRRWLAGQLLGATGLLLFAVALHLGRVVVVQPLLATQLVFSLLLVGALARRRHGRAGLDAALWGAAALVVGGLVVFGVSAHPVQDRGGPDVAAVREAWLLGSAGAALVLQVAAGLVGNLLTRGRRSVLLAVAAACGFGVDALLLKAVGAHLEAGEVLSWPLLALAVLAPSSLITAQRAFQAGSVTQALPAIAALEPVVAITVAGPALGEHLSDDPALRAGQAVGLLALLLGVVVLARRGPWATTPPSNGENHSNEDDDDGERGHHLTELHRPAPNG
ncbi:hypothetical protein SAMN06264364_13717 [Quadrisphaera granulorum]|uniref:Uncharacterized protein n=1 Tax=Quadrisphaera granulorum TaxID=317664 RepID=A0A315ZRZ8_9ACTN|nr:hypothetical protein BXY45_13717 [Quadrisphaera granulorum]SZE98775.1 hypothetical protein SAMN06264364_13717 [Quadrisphaera granulorum]